MFFLNLATTMRDRAAGKRFFASWLKTNDEWVSRGGIGDLSGSFGGV